MVRLMSKKRRKKQSDIHREDIEILGEEGFEDAEGEEADDLKEEHGLEEEEHEEVLEEEDSEEADFGEEDSEVADVSEETGDGEENSEEAPGEEELEEDERHRGDGGPAFRPELSE